MRRKILKTLRAFTWRQWLVAAAFLIVVGFTVSWAVRATTIAIYWQYHQDESIEGWMTVGYVAHSYHVPPHLLFHSLGLPHKPPDPRPLTDIAYAQNLTMDETRAKLQDAIIHARPPYPEPSPPTDDGEGQ